MKRLILLMLLMSFGLTGCGHVMQGLAQALGGDFARYQQPPMTAEVSGSQVVADNDSDGIPDVQDECNQTPAGVLVDAMGCPISLYVAVNLHYEGKSAVISPGNSGDIARIGTLLKENPDAVAVVEGHTDNEGEYKTNLMLSQRRAEKIKELIVTAYDVDPARIQTNGFADAKPLVSNSSLQGRMRNRRVEITVRGYYASRVTYVALAEPKSLHFALGQSSLDKSAQQEVAELAQRLAENPDAVAVIEGHTDNIGAKQSNLQLSEERAQGVKDILVKTFRIKPERLKVVGYGDAKPVASNSTEEGRFQNRRVTIKVQKPERMPRRAYAPNGTNPSYSLDSSV